MSGLRRTGAWVALIALFMCCVSCTTERFGWGTVRSPDGRYTAKVSGKARYGIQLPGPEPAPIKGRWCRLAVSEDQKKVFDSGWETTNKYTGFTGSVDMEWAPDSKRLAYRFVSSLRIIGADGTFYKSYKLGDGRDIVSSFRWVSDHELVVLIKVPDTSLLSFNGYSAYPSYIADATQVRVLRLNTGGGIEERFAQDVAEPTFLFRSISFQMDEISPSGARVAFSDGTNICVYDDTENKIIARSPVAGSIEGVWWQDQDAVVLGIGLLSGKKEFAVFDVRTQRLEDATAKLLPYWDGFRSDEWFRSAGLLRVSCPSGQTGGE